MVVFSSLRLFKDLSKNNAVLPMLKRCMSGHGHRMEIEPSRFQWHKFKDMVHLYFWVGAFPLGLLVMYCHIFIGPAKLAEIPEGYTPKPWEYYKHPITRWLARNVQTSYQQEYEKYMAYLYEEDELMKMRKVSRAVENKMSERNDYAAFYYTPVPAKYFREVRETSARTYEVWGENVDGETVDD